MNKKTMASRLEGRLFADNGSLCLVLEADPASETAIVSSHGGVTTMPLSSVEDKLSAYAYMTLDNLNSERTIHRIVSSDAGWYFKTRESGLAGPYESREKAKEAMDQYIISAQEGRKPEQR